MGFWEWMGFENPRDSPKTEQPKEGLPQITDNVRDSWQTFVFGRSNAGEQVDEKAAMQIPTVYACVRLLAESIAALPLHLYRVTDKNGNKEKARDHPLYKILYRQPNPEMTSFVFWETMMTHLLRWGNAYAQIVRDGKNTALGLYPLYQAVRIALRQFRFCPDVRQHDLDQNTLVHDVRCAGGLPSHGVASAGITAVGGL